MGAGGGTGVGGKQEGARGTRYLLQGFLYPLRWGWLPQAETLLRWAVPRLPPSAAGDT